MLELKKVSKFYNTNGVVTIGLRNISLKLNKGEIVAITGDSGSGKSTLLNVITGVDSYEEGEILFYGNETSYFDGEDMDSFRKNNVSFIYQKYNIIESYTVLENVMIPLILRGEEPKEARARALEIIDRVGLSKRYKHKGSKLSGGEKQRCVIARALASDSPILACDEPTGNLDSKTGADIIRLIKEVSEDKLVLIVTHNYEQVKDIVTRRIKISDGELVADEVITPSLEEENKPMELTTSRMSYKSALGFALKNIKATPKKSILISLVLLVVSSIALLMTLSAYAFSDSGESSRSYNVINEHNIVIYNNDLSEIDLAKLDYKDIMVNQFYENKLHNVKIGADLANVAFSELHMKKKLLYGRAPEAEGELYYIFPENAYISSSMGLDMELEYYLDKANSYYSLGKIVGIYSSSEVKLNTIAPYNKFPEEMKKRLNSSLIEGSYGENGKYKIACNLSYSDVNKKNTLVIPKGMEVASPSFSISGIYPISIDYDIEYQDGLYTPTLVLASPESDNFDFKVKPFIASIEVGNPVKAKNKLLSQGFSVTLPSNEASTSTIDIVLKNTYLAITIIAIAAMYFISYAIIARVYQSRIKDYGTLRALGVVRADLGRMTRLELILMTLSNTLLGILIVYLGGLISKAKYARYLGIGSVGFYLIVMLIFGILIAYKFSRRVYRRTVNTTLREGE